MCLERRRSTKELDVAVNMVELTAGSRHQSEQLALEPHPGPPVSASTILLINVIAFLSALAYIEFTQTIIVFVIAFLIGVVTAPRQ